MLLVGYSSQMDTYVCSKQRRQLKEEKKKKKNKDAIE